MCILHLIPLLLSHMAMLHLELLLSYHADGLLPEITITDYRLLENEKQCACACHGKKKKTFDLGS
jgi:hypothetical protein